METKQINIKRSHNCWINELKAEHWIEVESLRKWLSDMDRTKPAPDKSAREKLKRENKVHMEWIRDLELQVTKFKVDSNKIKEETKQNEKTYEARIKSKEQKLWTLTDELTSQTWISVDLRSELDKLWAAIKEKDEHDRSQRTSDQETCDFMQEEIDTLIQAKSDIEARLNDMVDENQKLWSRMATGGSFDDHYNTVDLLQ